MEKNNNLNIKVQVRADKSNAAKNLLKNDIKTMSDKLDALLVRLKIDKRTFGAEIAKIKPSIYADLHIRTDASSLKNIDREIAKIQNYINGKKLEISSSLGTSTGVNDEKLLDLYNEKAETIKNLQDAERKQSTDEANASKSKLNSTERELALQQDLLKNGNLESEQIKNKSDLLNRQSAEEQDIYNAKLESEAKLKKSKDDAARSELNNIGDINKALADMDQKHPSLKNGVFTGQYMPSNSGDAHFQAFLDDKFEEPVKLDKVTDQFYGADTAITKFTGILRNADGSIEKFNYGLDRTTNKVYSLNNSLKNNTKLKQSFTDGLTNAVSKTLSWASAMTLVYGTLRQLQNAAKFITDIDKDLTQIAITTGQTRQQTQGLLEDYVAIGKQMGKTVREISSLNAELVRQGLSVAESTERMQTVLKLSAAGAMDVNTTLSVITSSVNALGESAEKTGDVLLKAGMVSASGPKEIGDALQRVASSAKATGAGIEDVTAIVATMIDVTQESAESLGNSLKTIIARFNVVNEDTGEVNDTLNDVQEAFESIGITFRDQEGNIRPLFDLLSDLDKKWKTLTQTQKSFISTQAAGTMQQNRFLAIMENFDKVQFIRDEIEGSAGTLEDAYTTYTESVEAQFNQLTVAFESLYASWLNSDLLSGFLKLSTAVVDLAANINGKFVIGLLAALVAIKKFKILKDAFAAKDLKSFFGVFETSAKGVGTILKTLWVELTSVSKAFSLQKTQAALAALFTGKLSTETIKAAFAQGSLKVVLDAVKGSSIGAALGLEVFKAALTFGLSVLVSMAVAALSGLVGSLGASTKGMDDLAESSTKLAKQHMDNIKTIKNLEDEFKRLNKLIKENGSVTNLSAEDQEAYNDMVDKLVEISPSVVQYYDEKGNAVLRYSENLNDLIEKEETLLKLEYQKALAKAKDTKKEESDKIKDAQKTIKKAINKKNKLLKEEPLTQELLNTHGDNKVIRDIYEDDLLSYNFKHSELDGKIAEAQDKINQSRQELLDLVNSKLSVELYDLDGISDQATQSIYNIVENQFDKLFDKDYKTAAEKGFDVIDDIIEYYQKFNDIVGDSSDNIPNNVESLKALTEEMKRAGFSTEEANEILYQFISTFNDADSSTKTATINFTSLTASIEKTSDAIEKLNDMYLKLAKGGNLSSSELLSLIDTNEEVMDYILETGDLTLKNGEMLHEMRVQEQEDLLKTIRLKELETKTSQQSLQDELEKKKTLLTSLQSLGLFGTDEANETEKEISNLEESIEVQTKALSKYEKQIKVTQIALEQLNHATDEENSQELFDNATSNLADYKELLAELDKHGKLSGESNAKILKSYPELLHLVGDEAKLREELLRLTGEQKVTQQEAYRMMMIDSTSYYNQILKGNEELFGRIAKLYDIDVKNFKNAQQLKQAASQKASTEFLNAYKEAFKNSGKTEAEITDLALTDVMQKIENVNSGKLKNKLQEDGRTLLEWFEDEKTYLELLKHLNEVEVTLPEIDFEPTASSTSSTKSKVDKIELEVDAYLKLSKAIESVDTALSNSTRFTDKATGKERVSYLQKEIDLLTKKQSLTSQMATAYRKELADLEKGLGKSINLKDGASGIDSFAAYTKKQESAINSLIGRINATTDDTARTTLTEQKDALKDKYDGIKEDFERYLELSTELIPESGAAWWDIALEKADKNLQILDTNLSKYETQINRISTMMELMGEVREDDIEGLKKQYELIENLISVQSQSVNDIKKEIEANAKIVSSYEQKIAKLGTKSGSEYEGLMQTLVMAKSLQDELIERYETGIKNIVSEQENLHSKYVEGLETSKTATIKAFEDMRKEAQRFSNLDFKVSFDTILKELDKIDKIFIKNPALNLSTEEERAELSKWKDDLLTSLDKVNEYNTVFKSTMKAITDGTMTEEEGLKKINALLGDQISYENELKDLQSTLNEELAEMKLEHDKVEAALQNAIDLKQEELDALEEQHDKESKITSELEKQLKLMGVLDDKRNSYITGMGDEVFTYDVSEVAKLKKEIAEAKKEQEYEDKKSELEAEIAKQQEELEKTTAINNQKVETLNNSITQLGSILDLLSNDIEESMGEKGLEKIYEQMGNTFIDNINKAFQPIVESLQKIYSGTGITSATQSYTIQKGDTLSKIAEKSGTSLDALLELNPSLKGNKNPALIFGQALSVPRFNTGGYTGNVGDNGALAILDSKELVLNATDTQNILKSVDLARQFTETLGRLNMDSMVQDKVVQYMQTIENITINGVKDVADFKNELNSLLRKGMATLS